MLRKLIIAVILASALYLGHLAHSTDDYVEVLPGNHTYWLYIEREEVDWSKPTPEWELITDKQLTHTERNIYND